MSLLCRGFCPSCHRVGLQILPVFLLRRHRGLLLLSFRCLFARLYPPCPRCALIFTFSCSSMLRSRPPHQENRKHEDWPPSLVISREICDTITTDRKRKKKKKGKKERKYTSHISFYVHVLSPVHTVFAPTKCFLHLLPCCCSLIGRKIGGNDRIDRGAESHSCASDLRLRSDDIKKKKKRKNQVIYRVCCNVHCKVHWIAYEQSYKTSNLTALTYVTVRSDITLQYTMQHILNFFWLLAARFFFFLETGFN